MMCVGTFYPYFWAYLQQFDADIGYAQVYMAQPILFLANWAGMCKCYSVLIPVLNKLIGRRLTLGTGIVLVTLSFASVSVIQAPALFCAVFSVFMGVGIGLITMNSIWASWAFFPERRGLVAGVAMGGYGVGSIILNPLFAVLINPEDVAPADDSAGNIFPPEVCERVPWAFRVLACCYLAVGLIAVLAIRIHAVEEAKAQEPVRGGLCKPLCTRQFWCIFLANFTGLLWWGFVVTMYKIYGMTEIASDHALSYIASISSVFGIGGRLVWPMLADHFGVKRVWLVAMASGGVLSLLMVVGVHNVIAYGIVIGLSFIVGSGMYPLVSVAIAEVFGTELSQKLHPIMFGGSVAMCLFQWGCIFIAEDIGFIVLWVGCAVGICLGIVALVLLSGKYEANQTEADTQGNLEADKLENPLLNKD